MPEINSPLTCGSINEIERENALQHVRRENFQIILSALIPQMPTGSRLLDVGCAHGWFLDMAKKHFRAFGIEPDEQLYCAASSRGLSVRLGYFPEVLDQAEKFDVIVFNDVLEHIPDIQKVIAQCHSSLVMGGLLVLNLPSSEGFFYRLSKIACSFGVSSFFERLWQKNMPSPHLHYLNVLNLSKLLNTTGFDSSKGDRLSTLSFSGLYSRISYAGSSPLFIRLVICALVSFFLPLIRILPSDIIFVIAKKR